MPDTLTLVGEKRLRELLQMEVELKAAREVVEAAKIQHLRPLDDGTYGLCECSICERILKAANKYEEVTK